MSTQAARGFGVEVNEHVQAWGRAALEYGLYIWTYNEVTVSLGLGDWPTPMCPVSCSLLYDAVRSNSYQPMFTKIKAELDRRRAGE